LITAEQVADADPIPMRTRQPGAPALHELRVLDCSRVLAGPVSGYMLAASGADVLRVGADHLPSVPVGVMATGFGKRNASLDLRTEAGAEAMDALLDDTDVWIDAYRPGALQAHGFSAERAAARRPGVVVVQISAFDWTGPWAGRRGFDSIVQSTTGVRWAGGEAAVDGAGAPVGRGPIGLPVQALDYATGFLAAGVAAQLVAHQRSVGGSWLARLSLLRTRNWLVARGGPNPFEPSTVDVHPRFLHEVDSDFGRLTSVLPFVGRVGTPPRRLGTSTASWAT
jgi:crotonobetainyl-CoA:carnitine CoA-transferase CaiB-like acyl-CoA transferase